MPTKKQKHTEVAQIFKLAITGLPQSYWTQADLPEKLATLVDICVRAEWVKLSKGMK